MRKSLRPLIIVSVLLASIACVRHAKNSDVQEAPNGRWYAAERDVPPLELNYHKVLTPLPQGAEMLKRLCFGFDPLRSQDFDKVRQVFCQATAPSVTSLRDLQSVLGLAIPEATAGGREVNGKPGVTPGWALTGHSTSLVSRFVSPINPRVILFTAPQDASTPSPDFVVMGFVRGDQFVEVIARDPKAGRLNFFLVAFTQACNATGHCSTGHLQSSAIEKDWLSISIYEDTYLANTVFDCTHCHQPEGPSTEKILRLQEMEQPWLHFFRDDTQGQELIQAFKDFHGPDEGVGGVPASLIAASDPEKLVWLLKANGFGEQPSHLPAGTAGADAPWLEGWQRYIQGESIPFPSWANNILDPGRLPEIKERMDAAKAAGSWDDRPDLRLALDDRLSASYGARAPLDATGKELVALACQRCHNEKLDSNLGKSLFRADLKPSARSAFQAKNAMDRLNILRKDPSDPLAMPPRQFMDLTDAEIDLIIEELRDGREL